MSLPPTLRIPTGAPPLTITHTNCIPLLGVSWRWVTRFAHKHGVPIWRIDRMRFVPAAPLAAAIEAAAAAATPLTIADEAARWEAEIAEKFRRHT